MVRTSHHDDVDARAEAEALALEAFAELTGTDPVPRSRLQKADEAHAAAARGLPPVRHHSYPRAASHAAHFALVDASRTGRPFTPKRPHQDTRADLARRAAKRAAMARNLAAVVARLPAAAPAVPISRAARVAPVGRVFQGAGR